MDQPKIKLKAPTDTERVPASFKFPRKLYQEFGDLCQQANRSNTEVLERLMRMVVEGKIELERARGKGEF